MPTYQKLTPPRAGRKITRDASGRLVVPDDPIIPFIEGDGTGPDIWAASVRVFDAAVEKAYGGKRRIVWYEIYAGEKANAGLRRGTWLPEDTTAGDPRVPRRHQGPAHHARRRRHPLDSTSACARSSTSTPASARCASSRACPRR